MSFIASEIASQPACWRQAADLARTVKASMPESGQDVAVVGCGTSWFMADAYAKHREQAGSGRTDAFTASEFPLHRTYDRIVAITRSGTTTEVLDLLDQLKGRTRTVVLTADCSTPVVDLADEVIDLGFADERSVVQTVFATTALSLLRAQLGQDVSALADSAEPVLAQPVQPIWVAAEQITFLGSGSSYGIAQEAALKLREASQSWTEAYPAAEYRHGPISIAAPGRIVWHFGPADAALRDDVLATGAGFVDHDEDAQVDLVRVQLLAAARAESMGLDPDRPRNLTRSVVLTQTGSG